MDYFAIAKAQLSIVDVARDYGIIISNNNKTNCPWHTDKTPSLSFKNERYRCFGCGEHGDVFDFVGKLTNQKPIDVLKELNQLYRLGLDLNKPVPRAVIGEIERKRWEKRNFRKWKDNTYQILRSYLSLLRNWEKEFRPIHPDIPIEIRFVEVLHKKDYIEYVLEEIFCRSNDKEIALFMIEHEQMIRNIEQKLIKEGVSYAGGNRICEVPAIVGNLAA